MPWSDQSLVVRCAMLAGDARDAEIMRVHMGRRHLGRPAPPKILYARWYWDDCGDYARNWCWEIEVDDKPFPDARQYRLEAPDE